MTWRATLVAVALMAAAAVALFWLFQRQVGGPAPAFHLPAEMLPALEQSLADQKRLAELDPARQNDYRARFDKLGTTVGRLRILEHNRERLERRYELLLLALLAASVALATAYLALRHSRYRPRLEKIRDAVERLAGGTGPVRIDDRGRDPVGRIARMIEAASVDIARDRRRLRALRNLSRWQEAARRHAHEMRTPLGGARLTLDRLRGVAAGCDPGRGRQLSAGIDNLEVELERLGGFTEQFASFARLRPPELRRQRFAGLLDEFVATYEAAWSNLRLEVTGDRELVAAVDRDMIRQVLTNLCDNSSKALGEASGVVRLTLESRGAEARLLVADDGPGIPPAIRERLFEPYTTTREVGQGMGLGLAISLKIALDHGGDLELEETSARGTTFALSLPAVS